MPCSVSSQTLLLNGENCIAGAAGGPQWRATKLLHAKVQDTCM